MKEYTGRSMEELRTIKISQMTGEELEHLNINSGKETSSNPSHFSRLNKTLKGVFRSTGEATANAYRGMARKLDEIADEQEILDKISDEVAQAETIASETARKEVLAKHGITES